MTRGEIRVAAPNSTPNNQDVFIWALYLLGGADQEIDVEKIYMKAFELAPARLGWRIYPDVPDYKKTSKALQSVEAKTHVGLVRRTNPLSRKLTAEGVEWVEKFKSLFETIYIGQKVQASNNNRYERIRQRIRNSVSFQSWKVSHDLEILGLAEMFECQPASPKGIWNSRIDELKRAASVLSDEDLAEFSEHIEKFLTREGKI